MVYIKKNIRELMDDIDKSFTIDSGVEKWLRKCVYPKHNLIIKSKDYCYCTNCKKKFYSPLPIGNYETCPKCKQQLMIRKSTLTYERYRDTFRVVDYYNGYFIIRVFYILSTYKKYQMKHQFIEFQRVVIEKEHKYILVSNNFHNFLGNITITFENIEKWRLIPNHYYWYIARGEIYWDTLNKDIKDTTMQYCPIVQIVNTKDNENDEEIYLQRILRNPTAFELLTKLGLTKLALSCNKFTSTGSFQNRFGVSKDYLPFMIKYNINYDELEILRTIKKQKIRLIRKLSKLNHFKELSNYLDIEKAVANGLNKDNEDMYLDYLEFAVKLHLDMTDNDVLYPKNIKESHDKLMLEVEILENQEIANKIRERYEELKTNIYENDKYTIFPIPSMEDMVRESEVQHICIRTYNETYAYGRSDLYFLRLTNNIDKPLVAIEVKDNSIIQSRGKRNCNPTSEQMSFIKEWEQKVLKGVRKQYA